MKRVVTSVYLCLCLLLVLVSCKKPQTVAERVKDASAKEMLQGIWLDDNTDMPFFKVVGDSVIFPDEENQTVTFFVMDDSLYVEGADTIAYPILLQTPNRFSFKQMDDEVVSLYRSEEEDDAFYFSETPTSVPVVSEVLEKDSVVMYDGKRFRGYVFVNPSRMKVVRSSMDSSGMMVDNVYYDNIIHICVYTGAQLLYGKDITKKMFEGFVPDDFLEGSILADMNFMGVDGAGYHYQALIGQPDTSVGYLFNLTISSDKQLVIQPAD